MENQFCNNKIKKVKKKSHECFVSGSEKDSETDKTGRTRVQDNMVEFVDKKDSHV